MVKCTHCGREEVPYRGTHLIRNVGTISYFCSSKCQKNSIKLGRDKRKWKWTEAFHQTRDKAINKAVAQKEAQEAAAKEPAAAKKKVSRTRKVGEKKVYQK